MWGPETTVASATGRASRNVSRSASYTSTIAPPYQSSGSTNTWIVPPQVRPTAKASSSE